jgi:phosphoglucomutase
MSSLPSIQYLAQEWLRLDQDPETRQEIQDLLEANESGILELRLRNRINFGTAGLRARMEAGFSRINALTVIQTSQGLAEYLIDKVPHARHRGVVLGFDGRHNSEKFARLTAAAFVAKKFKVWWCGEPVHTPLVSFGVIEMRASAGVMITASHNPPKDNGYKVYWGNGCQIIPPHDSGIAEFIAKNLEPISWDVEAVDNSLLTEGMLNFVTEKYLEALRVAVDPKGLLKSVISKDISFSYTALHGVGLRIMVEAIKLLGIENHMKIVQEQAHPDPDFPGLPFPNPEEKGALDVAIWSANRHQTMLVLATDPDADRLAVAEKLAEDTWHLFTGNELGVLLASYVLDTYPYDKAKLAMIASTVSTSMIATMAAKNKFHFVETLTGFKWIGNKSIELDQQGFDTQFGMEEAIGYMLPGVTRDKDGVGAACLFLAATAYWRSSHQMTPHQKLEDLHKQYGYFETANTYLISPSPATTKGVFSTIRNLQESLPYSHPETLGKREILSWRDLTTGWDSTTRDHKPVLPVDSSSEMLTCEIEGGVRMTIRASGTEPKIKIYVECKCNSSKTAKKRALEVQQDAISDWLNPQKFGLSESH